MITGQKGLFINSMIIERKEIIDAIEKKDPLLMDSLKITGEIFFMV